MYDKLMHFIDMCQYKNTVYVTGCPLREIASRSCNLPDYLRRFPACVLVEERRAIGVLLLLLGLLGDPALRRISGDKTEGNVVLPGSGLFCEPRSPVSGTRCREASAPSMFFKQLRSAVFLGYARAASRIFCSVIAMIWSINMPTPSVHVH
jgi:hypothetical protein